MMKTVVGCVVALLAMASSNCTVIGPSAAGMEVPRDPGTLRIRPARERGTEADDPRNEGGGVSAY